ncbi:MAG: hypothetical protein CM15mV36_1130 [Caudoviricetes sp.]|jgi:hypothetical protein|nr:MAG: hypothetical protein CM15mV36_1130 [Caudoviricetes sp.]|tara:strand:- start:597 stop:776 length:180 start_codon:yes stop_codon:yes gene_type:complete
MRGDRHWDPVEDLEKELINELKDITKALGGTMCQLQRCNSMGRQSKVIQIEYNVEETKR